MKNLMDLHTHTLASGHAYNTINEMIDEAARKELKILGITEHAPSMPGSCNEYYFNTTNVIPREIKGVHVMFGAELNIIDYQGTIDLPKFVLKRLDVTIASMHIPCITPGTIEENTAAILGAMENPYIYIIGHPDDARYPLDYEVIVKKAKETGTILEVNNSSINPDGYRLNARVNYEQMLALCMAYQVPIIMSSDAHYSMSIADFSYIEEMMKEISFPEELIINYNEALFFEMIENKKNKQ